MPLVDVFDFATEEHTDTFVAEWNKRYGEKFGKVLKKFNDHDFGEYCSVKMNEAKFEAGLEEGIEDVMTKLADELNLDY